MSRTPPCHTNIRTGSLIPILITLTLGLGSGMEPRELAAQDSVVFDSSDVAGLTFRSIGPPRGGRSTAVAGITEKPLTYFLGGTGSGVWKTVDAGLNWVNISDGYFDVGSIGAIDVADSDPNVIYVGTGSADPRGNVSSGNGIYKSTDGGGTWAHTGLPNAGQIGRIAVHPENPDVAYAGVLGNIFGPNSERGVYRTRNGGATWENVLFVSDSTGVRDLALNPRNPRILFAATWRAERKPWTMISGAEEGGIWRTKDSGDTWEKLGGGLPEGLVGKAAVTVSRANPDRVWVLIEAPNDRGGVYRSDDGGDTWTHINDERRLQQRAWYYTHIYADPLDENTVYALNTGYNKSIDGGVTWTSYSVPHGDVHDLWVNYENPNFQVVANDGGAQVTTTGAESWSTYYNQPTAEIYRVFVDEQFPYRVYGSQQDNSTIMVPSRNMPAVQPAQHWSAVGGCESGHIAIDPRNPNVTYAGCYGGSINRVDRGTGDVRQMLLYPQLQLGHAASSLEHRFQWNAPIRLSPHDPDVVYHTSQFVNRTSDGGYSWETISPDLTRDDIDTQGFAGGRITWDNTGVEVYGTVFAFEESPHEAGVLWAGSDDGLIHVSRDDGANWENVTPQGLPEFSTVNMIDLSAHGPGRAHVAVYRYRVADTGAYMYRTNDYGQTWTRLGTTGLEAGHFVRVIREDPEREGLLFAGTENGLYVSFDGGDNWQPLQQNLPITPVTDLLIHQGDLVVATQGRSFWILDDLSPLREITTQSIAADMHLYSPKNAIRSQGVSPSGATVYFALAEEPEEALNLEFMDSRGDVVRVYSTKPDSWDGDAKTAIGRPTNWSPSQLQATQGLNRMTWDLGEEGPDLLDDAQLWGFAGRVPAVPGVYQVRLSMGDASQTRNLPLLIDPRIAHEVTIEDLQMQHDLMVQVREMLRQSHNAVREVRSVRTQMTDIAQTAKVAGYGDEFIEMADETGEKLTGVEEEVFQTKNESGQDPLNFPSMLDGEIANLYGYISSTYDRPNAIAAVRANELAEELEGHLQELQRIIETDVAEFNAKLREAGVPGVIVRTPPRATS
jgi:photosystem II stability/assembly factor-like uncharacterized protein